MPEFKYAKGRIMESIEFISIEMKEFGESYAKVTLDAYKKDKKIQKLTDRTVENILTALIEICGTILTQEGKTVDNYAQALGECAGIFGFTGKEQEDLSKLALQRNRLAHRYLDFRWQAVAMFNRLRPLISKLLKRIMEREEKER